MHLNNTIKLQIIKHGYRSIRDFSEKHDLSYYMVRKLANNESTSIDIEVLIKLCDAFNCEIGDLFYITKQKQVG